MAHVVFRIDRLHSLILRKIDSTFNGDNIILDIRLDAVAVDTGISSTTVNASGVSKISVTGKNVRPGVVPSVFLSTSRFCWTCSSCESDMAPLPS
jgi:hypothetical protein